MGMSYLQLCLVGCLLVLGVVDALAAGGRSHLSAGLGLRGRGLTAFRHFDGLIGYEEGVVCCLWMENA